MSQTPRVLTIAGTDPTGGAGSQADVKSITVAGGFAYAVTTAVLAQNTEGVQGIWMLEPATLQAQLDSVFNDCEIDAVKIGMLGSIEFMQVVGEFLQKVDCPVVLDPVMVATSGDRLIDDDALEALLQLLPSTTVITPNIPELEILAQLPAGSITTFEDACRHGQELSAKYGPLVAIKGGHLTGEVLVNGLVNERGVIARTQSPRLATKNTHGTGCSFSSALATRLGKGQSLQEALAWATRWMEEAIGAADSLHVGKGNGPIHHGAQLLRLAGAADVSPWLPMPVIDEDVADAGKFGAGGVAAEGSLFDPALPAAGPHTQRLWDASLPVLKQIWDLPFIQKLKDGTLERRDFVAYLRQDAHYLDKHASALGLLAARTLDVEECLHFTDMARLSLIGEKQLHEDWIAKAADLGAQEQALAQLPATPITAGYTDFLLARTSLENFAVAATAILPCAWVYAQIGIHLAKFNHAEHPYGNWLSTYSDEEFLVAAQRDIEIVEKYLAAAGEADCDRALEVYLTSCVWEREFFDQTSRLAVM